MSDVGQLESYGLRIPSTCCIIKDVMEHSTTDAEAFGNAVSIGDSAEISDGAAWMTTTRQQFDEAR